MASWVYDPFGAVARTPAGRSPRCKLCGGMIAGTANGAELLGLADQVGTLTAGKLADIVAVEGNPLTDMKATEHAVFVMKEGTVYVAPPSGR